MKKISIVIPAYNEGRRLHKVISAIRRINKSIPIIVVDDGSPKKINLHNSSNLTLLRHPINLGKGSALMTGAQYSFYRKKIDALIFIDADGQHDPKEIPKFISKLNQGYDLVFGSRSSIINAPLIRLLGNKFSSIYLNLMFGIYLSDTLCGYRGISSKAYKKIKWQSQRYGVEPEMIARLGIHQKSLTYCEILIDTIYIDKYKGVTILDALLILINSLWWKLS